MPLINDSTSAKYRPSSYHSLAAAPHVVLDVSESFCHSFDTLLDCVILDFLYLNPVTSGRLLQLAWLPSFTIFFTIFRKDLLTGSHICSLSMLHCLILQMLEGGEGSF